MDLDSEQIRPAEFKVGSWKDPGGLVAMRKSREEFLKEFSHERLEIIQSTGEQLPVNALPPLSNIAAIDFGTTYCSLAIVTVGGTFPSCIKLDGYRPRVSNAILLKKESSNATSVCCSIKEFGPRAQDEHTKLKADTVNQHLFFERIKMNLQHDPDVHRGMTVQAQDGSQWYLIEVIAFMICSVKDFLVDHLSRSPTPLKETHFNWVITVPAIWQSRGRRMMREAGYMAGLCSGHPSITSLTLQGQVIERPQVTNEESLALVPEPDAAALYCQHMTAMGKVAEHCEEVNTDKSHRYIVVDIGGGTVDITAQKLLSSNGDNTIEVIHPPIGNDGGGTSVNRELIKLVQGIVGEEGDPFSLETAFPSFFQSDQVSAAQKALLVAAFYKDFEQKKEIFGDRAELSESQNDDNDLSFKMPHTFFKHYKIQINNFAKTNTDKRIVIEDDEIFISYSFAKNLFQPAMNKILECTKSVLFKLTSQVDTIFLVGGFGGCNYVYQHIREMMNAKFHNLKYRLIVPLDYKLAIVLGAILFRQPSTKFVSCVASATYGLAVSVPFNREIHPTSHFQYDEDGYEKICTGVFLTFINEGEIAQSSEIAVEDIVPLVDNTKQVTIPFYRSFTPSLEYVWEYKDKKKVQNASKIGEIVIKIPEGDVTHRSQRKFRIMFDFSKPEIKVFARYMSREQPLLVVNLEFLEKQAK